MKPKAREKEKPRFFLASLMGAALALAATTAHATVTDWGIHDPVEVGVGTPGNGSFMDFFTFTLPVINDLGSSTVANNLFIQGSPELHITDGMVQLFEGTYGDATPDTLKLSYSFDGTTGNVSHVLGDLSSGPFYYEISGMADGAHGGVYTISSAFTTPVPEPETYGMLMAGLGLMGYMARRKAGKS